MPAERMGDCIGDAPQAADASKRTPVTIITGFLGSGKTTLLRHVLTVNHGRRIAVIQNEMAEETGIEAPSVTGADGQQFEEWVELANGCVCCSVKDDLVVALERLIEKRGHFDYILVETTGMADPGPVASVFWVDDELESPLYLDGIVTLVDAQNFTKHLHQVEACRQVASADRVLLNKTDLVNGEALQHVEAYIRRLNDSAPVIRTAHSATALEELLDIHAFEHCMQAQLCDPTASSFSCGECGIGHGLAGPCQHLHDAPDIGSVTVTMPGEVDERALTRFLGELLWERGEADVYRCKGMVAVAGEECRYMLQGVHCTFELTPSKAWAPDEDRTGKLVFIGRGLLRCDLEPGLLACLAGASDAMEE